MSSVLQRSEIEAILAELDREGCSYVPREGVDIKEDGFDYAAFIGECVEVREFLMGAPWLVARAEESENSEWGRRYVDAGIERRVLAIAKAFSKCSKVWEEKKAVINAYLDIRENTSDPLVEITRSLCGDGNRFG
jgi:hypothetical protein